MAKKKPIHKTSPAPIVARETKYASLALACGLLSVVPLLNIVAIPAGIVFGIMGIRRSRTQPGEPGMVRAVIGLVLCGVWLIMTAYAMLVYGPAALLQR